MFLRHQAQVHQIVVAALDRAGLAQTLRVGRGKLTRFKRPPRMVAKERHREIINIFLLEQK